MRRQRSREPRVLRDHATPHRWLQNWSTRVPPLQLSFCRDHNDLRNPPPGFPTLVCQPGIRSERCARVVPPTATGSSERTLPSMQSKIWVRSAKSSASTNREVYALGGRSFFLRNRGTCRQPGSFFSARPSRKPCTVLHKDSIPVRFFIPQIGFVSQNGQSALL